MAAKLRHGADHLTPSQIAKQYYCEYEVHLKRLHPEVRIELPTLDDGEEGHAALASEAKPITQAELEQEIRAGKKLAISEWTMEARCQDVLLRGRPDFLAVDGKTAVLLLDFKFSRAKLRSTTI